MLRKISPTDNILTPWSARGKPKCSGIYEFLGVYDRPQEWKGTLAKKTTYEHIKNANKYSVS